MKLPVVRADSALREVLQSGHPWIYRSQLAGEPERESGTWVEVRAGNEAAIGLWDEEGAIAVRLFGHRLLPDARWWQERVHEAWIGRAALRAGGTTAFRWLNGESEGTPGMTVDLYGGFAVVRTYATSLAALVEPLAAALRRETALEGIVWRPHRGDAALEVHDQDEDGQRVQLVWGTMPPADLVVQEGGATFRANLRSGQKTGLFLDQRDNRATVAALARGRSVLNCFAYTGAFGVYALRGGAQHVTQVDIAQPLAAEAQAHLQMNGFDPAQHPFVVADCFDLLARYREEGRTFDLVVLDPPSFAHSRKQVQGALRAYSRLNSLGIGCVAPGGLLATASCTAQVSATEFRGALADAARMAGRRLLVTHEAGQPIDHPVAAHFPEGRYLKFVVARVLMPV
ncbi:MAG: class I SAM-dependent rRNA methyltransferase [Herpetosiphon sp.]